MRQSTLEKIRDYVVGMLLALGVMSIPTSFLFTLVYSQYQQAQERFETTMELCQKVHPKWSKDKCRWEIRQSNQ